MRAVVLGLAGLALGSLVIGGCSSGHLQFGGGIHYDNLLSEDVKDSMRARVRTEILARAEQFDVLPVRVNDRDMLFRMRAPDWRFPLPGGGFQTREDERIVEVKVDLGGRGAGGYVYRATTIGNEPEGFTDEARGRFGIALLALREIFETPMDTDFIDGITVGRVYELEPALIDVGRRAELRPRTGLLPLDEAVRLATSEAERVGFDIDVPEQGVLVLRDRYPRPRGDEATVAATLTFEVVPGTRDVRRLVLDLADESAQVDSGFRTPEGRPITTNDFLAERLGRVAMAVATEREDR
ncbi:MAG: hypothetical protein AAF297_10145 [Planctomycetota bacterium]